MNVKLKNSIKTLVRSYYDYQNERLALDGRLEMKKDGSAKKDAKPSDEILLVSLYERRNGIREFELKLEKEMATEVHKHDLWKTYLCNVKGIGEVLAAVIISEFDIYKAPHVSNLWSFAGVATGEKNGRKIVKTKNPESYNPRQGHVVDRKKNCVIVEIDEKVRIDKKTPGYMRPYNQFLRDKLCGVLGGSFLKSNSPYREFYDNMKHRLESENWGTASKNPTDLKRPKAGHQHKAATRYMIKMFLKDLYVAWRTLEGLVVSEPYQKKYLGHDHEKNHPKSA